MTVPSRLVRRLAVAPLVASAEVALLLAWPVLAGVAVVLSPFLGGRRPLRLLVIVLTGAACHLAAMAACLGLWLASGCGLAMPTRPFQRANYGVMRWFASSLYDTVVRVARVTVTTLDSAAAQAALEQAERPVILMSRHAGEGDTLLVIHHLLSLHGRTPRLIMHELLRLDPLVDALGERLPNRFLDPRGGDSEREVEALARELDADGALVIFPEGGNFSRDRRARAIERLERDGRPEKAALAREMRHVSAPRPGGSLAAIAGAPAADVVVMGHVGFPNGLRELWRLLPERQSVEVRMWHFPAGDLPAGHEERIDWLFDRWRDLDAWIEERTTAR